MYFRQIVTTQLEASLVPRLISSSARRMRKSLGTRLIGSSQRNRCHSRIVARQVYVSHAHMCENFLTMVTTPGLGPFVLADSRTERLHVPLTVPLTVTSNRHRLIRTYNIQSFLMSVGLQSDNTAHK